MQAAVLGGCSSQGGRETLGAARVEGPLWAMAPGVLLGGRTELRSQALPAKALLPVQAEKRFYWRGYQQSGEQQNDFLWRVPRMAEGTLPTSLCWHVKEKWYPLAQRS